MGPPMKKKPKILPPQVIDELVSTSSNYLNEILKDLTEMIQTEATEARRELLTKIKNNVVKERANFRVLSRQIEAKTDYDFSKGDGRVTKKSVNEFTLLPEKLAEQLATELQGWCIHVERPEILHLGHVRYRTSTREFFCDSIVSLIQRPDQLDKVYVNIIYLDPETDGVSKENQRFSFPLEDITNALVPLLKSTEGKWALEYKKLTAASAAGQESEDWSSNRSRSKGWVADVKEEPIEEPVKEPLMLEGKRKRPLRFSKEFIQEACEDSEGDVFEEQPKNSKGALLERERERARRARELDDDYDPAEHRKRDWDAVEGSPFEIVGKCFLCEDCLTYEDCFTHMEEKHKDEPLQICNCPICSKRPSNFAQHMKKYHLKDEHWDDLTCDECKRPFQRKFQLDEHKIIAHHPHLKTAACEECDLKFASQRLLTNHMQQAHEEKPENPENPEKSEGKKVKHICYHCGKNYKSPANLQDHINSKHETAKKFKCVLCPKEFSTTKNLQHHLTVHTDARPYKCSECEKSFKTKTHLRQHKNSHGPPKYECAYCAQKFSFRACMQNHVKAIHKVDPVTRQPLVENGDAPGQEFDDDDDDDDDDTKEETYEIHEADDSNSGDFSGLL